MRIGLDVHAAERDGSGNCTYVRGLARRLPLLAPEATFFFYGLDLGHPFYREVEGMANVHLRRLFPRNPLLRIPLSLAVASVRDRLDVLHVQYVAPPWHRGSRVVTIHDVAFLAVPDTFAPVERLRLRLQVRANARRAHAVVTGTSTSRAEILRALPVPPERVFVTPYGPGLAWSPPPDEEAQTRVLERRRVKPPFYLALGRLNPRKNLPRVLAAFDRLRETREARLAVVGHDDYGAEDLREQMSRLRWRSEVEVLGYVPGDEVAALYSAARAFVYPSLYEGFGFPPLEAMRCGTPVITSRGSATAEVVGDGGLLVDPRNIAELEEAMGRLLDDEVLWSDLRSRGRQRAERFDWDTTARKTLHAYRAAKGRPRRERWPPSSGRP